MTTLLKNSITNLKGHKLRLVIAFIWIIIGITSVVFISSVGNAMNAAFKNTFSTISPKEAIIYFTTKDGEDADSESTRADLKNANSLESMFVDPFTKSDVSSIKTMEGVKNVTSSSGPVPMLGMSNENVFSGNISYYDNSDSVDVSPFEGSHYKIKSGRPLNNSDEGENNIVIPEKVAKVLFGDEDPLGKGVTINNETFQVVGIIDKNYVYNDIEHKFKKKTSFDIDKNNAYVSNRYFNILNGNYFSDNKITYLKVTVKDNYNVKEVTDSIINELKSKHAGIEGNYRVQDESSIQKSLNSITGFINKFVILITVIAMIIGGVGIMNIMYVSVMERTKEIGIRRALGAKPRDIMYQFLVESVFITSIGGIMGVIVGFIVTKASGKYMPFNPIIHVNSFVYAFLTIVLTGIIFGLVPAYKASKVDPIKIIYK